MLAAFQRSEGRALSGITVGLILRESCWLTVGPEIVVYKIFDHLDDARVPEVFHDLDFFQLVLSTPFHVWYLNSFYCVNLSVSFAPDLSYDSKSTFADYFDDVEIRSGQFLLLGQVMKRLVVDCKVLRGQLRRILLYWWQRIVVGPLLLLIVLLGRILSPYNFLDLKPEALVAHSSDFAASIYEWAVVSLRV